MLAQSQVALERWPMPGIFIAAVCLLICINGTPSKICD